MSRWVERLFYPGAPEGTMRELALSPLAVAAWTSLAERTPGLRVISVGNVQVGGAGKTPVVRALAERLIRRGQPVAILSRGYGRTATGDVRVEGPPWPEPERCGDERIERRHNAPDAALVKTNERKFTRNRFVVDDTRDEIARDHKENINPDIAAIEIAHAPMKGDHRQHGKAAQAVDIGAVG